MENKLSDLKFKWKNSEEKKKSRKAFNVGPSCRKKRKNNRDTSNPV